MPLVNVSEHLGQGWKDGIEMFLWLPLSMNSLRQFWQLHPVILMSTFSEHFGQHVFPIKSM